MKLSIITINYNNRAGLEKTIQSVLSQTFSSYEWIVIDGGSNDGSKELIEQYQNHFSYWCSEPDKGIYNAMNKGIDHAKGEYVIFMNSGDVFYDENSAKCLEKADPTADIISGLAVRMDNNVLIRTYDDNLFMLLYNDTLNHQGTFIRRTLFGQRRYDEKLRIVSDWKFWIEMILVKNAKVQLLKQIIAIQDMTGISPNSPELNMIERQKVLDEFFPKSVQSVINEYRDLRESIYYKRAMALKQLRPSAYAFVRKLMGLILMVVGRSH